MLCLSLIPAPPSDSRAGVTSQTHDCASFEMNPKAALRAGHSCLLPCRSHGPEATGSAQHTELLSAFSPLPPSSLACGLQTEKRKDLWPGRLENLGVQRCLYHRLLLCCQLSKDKTTSLHLCPGWFVFSIIDHVLCVKLFAYTVTPQDSP